MAWNRICLWLVQITCLCPLPCVPSCLSSSLFIGRQNEKQRRSCCCKHCASIAEILVRYHHAFGHRSVIQLHSSFYQENSVGSAIYQGKRLDTSITRSLMRTGLPPQPMSLRDKKNISKSFIDLCENLMTRFYYTGNFAVFL